MEDIWRNDNEIFINLLSTRSYHEKDMIDWITNSLAFLQMSPMSQNVTWRQFLILSEQCQSTQKPKNDIPFSMLKNFSYILHT